MQNEQQPIPDTLLQAICKLSENKPLTVEEKTVFKNSFPDIQHLASLSISAATLDRLKNYDDNAAGYWSAFKEKYKGRFHQPAAGGEPVPVSSPMPVDAIVRPVNYKRLLVAAAVIILIGSGLYRYFSYRPGGEEEYVNVKVPKSEIVPGGNAGTLVLADNTLIQLATAKEGVIATQGNMTIRKIDSGEIKYERTNAAVRTSVFSNTLLTPKGGTYRVQLPDSSIIYANAESSIMYPASFDGASREVILQKGEVYFDVAHNGKPFIVKLNGFDIRVTGTRFNVNSYENETKIKATLEQGSITIIKGDKEYPVKPGQQAEISKTTGEVYINPHVNTELVLGWKDGLFRFENMDIRTIMRQVERWYNVTVTYEYEPSVTPLVLRKITRAVPLRELLDILKVPGGFQYEIHDRQLILRK